MKKLVYILSTILIPSALWAQNEGVVSGDLNLNIQTYIEDSSINAQKVDEKMLMNSFSNIRFTKGDFTVGLRYESYLNALQDFDSRHQGNGIPYRFAQYTIDGLNVTVGNFYEQFGNGLIFRSYEEKDVGIDNVMDGIRLQYRPAKGLTVKGFIGKQRLFFEHGPGIVRGIDGELDVNEALSFFSNSQTRAIFGASFVSRFQEDLEPAYTLPENVAAYAIRTSISRGKVTFNSEYAYKHNDPKGGSTGSNFAPGNALMSNISYSQRGLGIILEGHRVDNMDFRSDRTATGKELTLSYIPAITKQHTYSLAALYPFATQPMGELGFQGEINYTFKKKSTLGGKYGTQLAVNYSRVNGLNGGHSVHNGISAEEHRPMFFSLADEERFFRDFNLVLKKKLNKKMKFIAHYVDLIYNKDVVQGKNYGKDIHSRVFVMDFNYKIKPKHSLRTEVQYLAIDDSDEFDHDQGDWLLGLVEYTISPHWFFAIMDQYNGGYTDHDGIAHDAVHYFNVNCGYTKGANRFAVGYGKKREGIFCVGGVCKNVPSSNGLTISITSSF